MRILWITLVLLLWVAPAAARSWPAVLVDQTCTDSFDTPAATSVYQFRPDAQLTGSGDGFCDDDSRILTGAITVDTDFGPFDFTAGIIHAVVDAISGGSTDFNLQLVAPIPWVPATKLPYESTAAVNSTGTYDWAVAPGWAGGEVQDFMNRPFVRGALLRLNLVSATSITINLGIIPARGTY